MAATNNMGTLFNPLAVWAAGIGLVLALGAASVAQRSSLMTAMALFEAAGTGIYLWNKGTRPRKRKQKSRRLFSNSFMATP